MGAWEDGLCDATLLHLISIYCFVICVLQLCGKEGRAHLESVVPVPHVCLTAEKIYLKEK